MQLLLYNGPAKALSSKAKLNSRIYDPESSGEIMWSYIGSSDTLIFTSDDRLKFIQLLFDLKPSSETCEVINKV